MPNLSQEVAKRRTFAIISHPDAGKTTLTEKFLLYGGAIQMAGQVRAKGEARRTRSDFMKMEQERGISVSASAMSFDYGNFRYNLVDTPGHSDFSEDTYRTLTAVDAAIMVIDGAKGVESQTQKLFEVCRLRDLPILTFCNKMDREARDTFEIIDEIQENLAIDVTPASWPIGMGRDFVGCYDMLRNRLEIMDRADRNKVAESIREQAEQKGLEEAFEEVLVPKEEVVELRRGRKVPTERKFFPGYVLVKMDMTDETYHLVKNTAKVTGFLGADNKPMPVSEAEVNRILQQVQEGVERPRPSITFEIGEQVRVADDPFASFNGLVEEVDEEKARLKVAVSIFGRATPVELEYSQVEKL